MRILVDECLPKDLVGWLPEWDIGMVQQMGGAGVKNGELQRRAQNLKGHRLAILLLPANRRVDDRGH